MSRRVAQYLGAMFTRPGARPRGWPGRQIRGREAPRSYSRGMRAFESLSTWRQPVPAPASAVRTKLISDVAAEVAGLSPRRLRVAIDGLTGAGKTSFGHELAAALRDLGRASLRASLDDFKNPWREARELGYDRVSGEGYYRNAYDFRAARELLLGPAGPAGSGAVALCGHDPLTPPR